MTYGLIAVVIAVWGIIFYRIFNSISSEEKPVAFTSFNSTQVEEQDKALTDTFRLIATGRDPFLGNVAKAKTIGLPKRASKKIKVPEVPVDWSFIGYNGIVYNPSAKKKVVFMTIHGREVMMNEGDKADEVTLVKNFGDSVKVAFSGQTHVVRLP